MNIRKLLVIILIFGSFACSQQEKTNADSEEILLSLEIVDSLDLEILGDPLITAASNSGKSFLFYDFASENILITDDNGNIQSQFNKSEDTPDSYGFMMEAPGFVGEDRIAIAGMGGIFIYDLEGNMIKKINHPESVGGAGFMAFPGKSMESTELNGKIHLLSKSVRSRDTYPGEQKYYDTFRHLELVDIEDESSIEMIPFEENSRFLDGMGYLESDFWPALEAKNKKLYIALGGEPKLYRYSLSTKGATLDTLIQLSIPGFEEIEGSPRAEFSEGMVILNGGTASIQNIHIIGEKLLLNYYGGISPEDSEAISQLFEAGKMEEAEELYISTDNKTSRGILVFDLKSLAFLGNLSLPKEADLESFASGGDYLWMQKNPSEEVEEDFLRIYKVKLAGK